MKRQNAQSGFTIIELLFSTLVFSVVLLMSLTALVQIGRLYYKGVTTSQTQQTARNVLDEISQAIQFTGVGVVPTTLVAGPNIAYGGTPMANASGYFCIGNTRYSYAIDRQQSDSPVANDKQIRHVLWADQLSSCQTGLSPVDLTQPKPTSGANDKELMGANMRLTKLEVTKLTSDNTTWEVKITVLYGDEDLTIVYPEDTTRKVCKGGQLGTQFCAISELSTVVKRRII